MDLPGQSDVKARLNATGDKESGHQCVPVGSLLERVELYVPKKHFRAL
jgi:hypothetical protein